MNTVQPIRDVKKINSIKKILLSQSERDHLLFVFGINCGLRISDILKLQFFDILDERGKVKKHIELYENKTGKWKRFPLNKNATKAIELFLSSKETWKFEEYIFTSREGVNKPIGRHRAYQVINEAARTCGITDPIGTHTLRKTFGYHSFRGGADITLLQKIFGHSAPSITMRYLGITQDEMDSVYINLNL